MEEQTSLYRFAVIVSVKSLIVVIFWLNDTLRRHYPEVGGTVYRPYVLITYVTALYCNPEYHSLNLPLVFGVHVSFLAEQMWQQRNPHSPFFTTLRISNKNACVLEFHEFLL